MGDGTILHTKLSACWEKALGDTHGRGVYVAKAISKSRPAGSIRGAQCKTHILKCGNLFGSWILADV
jgi:hypothetical protein